MKVRVRGSPPNGIFGPCACLLAGGCGAWRLLARRRRRHRRAASFCTGTTWGTLKSMKIDKIHKIHAPKIQGRVFFEGAEAPQAAATQPQRAWGALKSMNTDKIFVYTHKDQRSSKK